MSTILTVLSPRPFTDGRALPEAAKWLPTSSGFAYESQTWRITVFASVPVASSRTPAAAGARGREDLYRTEVALDAESAPPAVRELFECTARNIATHTRGRALDDVGPLAPPRMIMRTREAAEMSATSRRAGDDAELIKAGLLLRHDRVPSRTPWTQVGIVLAVLAIVAALARAWWKSRG
jgi:hypothetical protein